MKNLLMQIFFLVILSSPALAVGQGQQIVVHVKGMVCAFCAQGIEKNLTARPEVKETKVNLDDMTVAITFEKDKSLDKSEIEKIVTGAGFSYVGIKNEQAQ